MQRDLEGREGFAEKRLLPYFAIKAKSDSLAPDHRKHLRRRLSSGHSGRRTLSHGFEASSPGAFLVEFASEVLFLRIFHEKPLPSLIIDPIDR